jgi:hypothetical protein
VLLPSDTHRKSITSITAVLLPFVTCLLTRPCNNNGASNKAVEGNGKCKGRADPYADSIYMRAEDLYVFLLVI